MSVADPMEVGDIGFGYRERAAYASHPEESRGRLFPEPESRTRTPFQRDRDRIIHSTAFRRLKHKTQVFIAHEADHYRTRLTHSIEVAQIARALARALRGDEDLAEAVALVHDFGHTPFGHAGERGARPCDEADFGGFDHNAQSLRIVTRLEQRYAEFDGLNLTWETLEGLVKHNGPLTDAAGQGLKGPVPQPILEYDAVNPLRLSTLCVDRGAGGGDRRRHRLQCPRHRRRPARRAPDARHAATRYPSPSGSSPTCARAIPKLEVARTCYEVTRRQITAMVEDVIVTSKAAHCRDRAADVRRHPQCRPADGGLFRRDGDERRRAEDIPLCLALSQPGRDGRDGHRPKASLRDLFSAYLEDPAANAGRLAERRTGRRSAPEAAHEADFRFSGRHDRQLCATRASPAV